MQGLFVTGTDTGVGKTVVSAALALRTGFGYWKPVQTGLVSDTTEVQRLAGCQVFDQGIRLPEPVSPHLAAELAGARIEVAEIVGQSPSDGSWIVEGAGGVLVPLNEREKMIDLMAALALPVVVVARSRLGTINHTLLTLEALRGRGLRVELVVMSGPANPDNLAAIRQFGNVPAIEMPRFHPLTPEKLKEWAL
jgi:dethiobiotin synthase